MTATCRNPDCSNRLCQIEQARARISDLEAALSLARAYVEANGGGWCRDGIGSLEVLRRTDVIGSSLEREVSK